ncbi:MAG: PEP-CTERM sorting domain-containing protein [Thermodesulfobacteriota bacterium]
MIKVTGKAKFLLMVGAIFLILPAIVQATPWQKDDNLEISLVSEYSVWSKIDGYGGLFKIENTTRGETVYGFCVELNEWLLSPSKVYDADDDEVWKGGRNTDSGDNLSGGTQWLYWKYLTDPNYQTVDAVKAIQLAIWYLEDEYYDLPDKDGDGDVDEDDFQLWYGGSLGEQARDYILAAKEHVNFTSNQILALDVYDGSNQKQSYIYYIPEPATLIMLGVGLLGFGIFARRFSRKTI